MRIQATDRAKLPLRPEEIRLPDLLLGIVGECAELLRPLMIRPRANWDRRI